MSDARTNEQNVWRLTDEKLNELQVRSVDDLIKRSKAAHFVNVHVRINGKWEIYEADWIKHMAREEALPLGTGLGARVGNKFSFSFPTDKEAERVFRAVARLCKLETSEPSEALPALEHVK